MALVGGFVWWLYKIVVMLGNYGGNRLFREFFVVVVVLHWESVTLNLAPKQITIFLLLLD